MAWTKYIMGEQEPEAGQDVLVVILRKKFGDDPQERERHVGHRNTNGFWVVGGHFGFDMGDILYYQEMEEIPEERDYDTVLDKEDDVMTVEDWLNAVKDGCFHNEDGCGYWVKDGLGCDDEVFNSTPLDATHVVWYNK